MEIDDVLNKIFVLARDHIEACFVELYDEEEVESPAVAPFCGCADCVAREILMVAWKELIGGAIIYIEENSKDQEAINAIYARALRRIAAGEVEDPKLLAELTLGEGDGGLV